MWRLFLLKFPNQDWTLGVWVEDGDVQGETIACLGAFDSRLVARVLAAVLVLLHDCLDLVFESALWCWLVIECVSKPSMLR